MEIKLINNKWTVNGKTFAELTPSEKELLNQFFKILKEEFQSIKIDQNKVIITEPFKIKQI